MPPPCSEGSACAVGDVGVYCQCYSRVSGEETCLDNQAGRLSLSVVTSPEITFPPHVLEGDLLLELLSDHFQTTSTNSSTSNRMDGTGVVWNVSALSSGTSAPWTIFPSTGLLLPGQSINLRVTNSPSDDFDGTTNITFGVDGMGISADRESSQRASFAEVSMTVTYFHCPAGKFWNSTYCQLCTDADMNGDEGLICSVPGVSTKTLPVTAGYWRANLSDTSIREC
ncbi:unnamed protein product, partial [Sphacelaria rigidula]